MPHISKQEHLINEEITVAQVRLVGEDGEQLGIVPIDQAQNLSIDKGLDLVMIAPKAEPPVCRIMDYGKFRFEQEKREKEAKKKQQIVETKEIQLSCNIGEHDFQTKLISLAECFIKYPEITYDYLRQGIGGYSLIYPQVCISPAILAWIYKSFKNNKIFFAIGIAWTYTFVRLLELAGYSIALFASAIGLLLLLLYRGKNIIPAFIVTILVFVAIMASILYFAPFREWILETFDGTAVARKVNDLVSTSDTGVTGDSIQLRIDAYSNSLMDMLKYPIIGSLWREGGGGHSAVLDTISKYGWLGGYALVMMFYHVPLHYKHQYGNNKFIISTANATLITLLFVSIADSFTFSFTCMILIISSLLFEDIIKWTGAEKT